MLTTITVNGTEGVRFLASLGSRFRGPLPPALAAMIDHVKVARPNDHVALEVESWLADQIAELVAELVHAGFEGVQQPLLFSAQIGDQVILVRDALVEMQVSKHEMRTWRWMPAGTRGRVTSRRGDTCKVVLRDGPEAGEHAYISDRCVTRHKRS
jgi:hypothetical protein